MAAHISCMEGLMVEGDQPISDKIVPTSNYLVGRGKPPEHSRWKPGQSGNPQGAKKRKLTSDIGDAVQEALQEVVCLPCGGKRRRMSLAQAAAYKRVVAAAGGDASAFKDVMRLQQMRGGSDAVDADGWTVIEAKLVFDEEERRLDILINENDRMRAKLEEIRAALNEKGIDLGL